MLWQTDKTVMIGNNQLYKAEADYDFAEKAGINLVRRSSGGGAIYTDRGTVLYTFIEPVSSDIKTHRENTAAEIIDALGKIGASAVREGKNDILLDGKKISGLAQYTSADHVCTHGSLLYDTGLDILTRVLTPAKTKLQSKGIASVRSRVTNIRPYLKTDYSTNEFINKLKELITGKTNCENYILNNSELKKIGLIYNEKYGNKEWNYRI